MRKLWTPWVVLKFLFLLSTVLFLGASDLEASDSGNSSGQSEDKAAAHPAAEEATAENEVNGESRNKLASSLNILKSVKNCPSCLELEKLMGAGSTFDECHNRFPFAKYMCLENFNPDISMAVGAINALASGLSVAGVTNQCSTMGQIMGVAQKAMTLYSAGCTAAKLACSHICEEASESLKKIQVNLQMEVASNPDCHPAQSAMGPPAPTPPECQKQVKASNDVMIAATSELNEADPAKKSLGMKLKNCDRNFTVNVLAAGAGLVGSILPMLQEAKKCKDKTVANQASQLTKSLPTTPVNSLASTEVDCSKAEFANKPECICLVSPRNPGCSNLLSKSGGGTVGTFGNPNSGNPMGASQSNATPSMPFLGPSNNSNIKAADGAGGAPPSSGGSSSLAADGGRTAESGGSGSGDGNRKGLNKKLVAGNGGGGGGRMGGRGGSYQSASRTPNGVNAKRAHDENAKKMAAYLDARRQVGYPGSSSLFERINGAHRRIRRSMDPAEQPK